MARPSKLGLHDSESAGLAGFMDRVMMEPMSGCWLWIGDCTRRGYGRFQRNQYAHRASYELFVGRIPDGLVIDHKCRTLCCVNPDHLEAVTQKTNVRRGDAAKVKKQTCKLGHPLSRRQPASQLVCVICQNERARAYRARKKVGNV